MEELQYYNEIVKIDQAAPLFDLPAYDPIKDTDTKDFWLPIVTSKTFNEFVQNKYQIAHGDIISDEDIAAEIEVFGADADE